MSSNSLQTTNSVPAKRKVSKQTPHNCDLILADISSSMGRTDCKDGRSRIANLRDALQPLKHKAQVLAFNNKVFEVDADEIPDEHGSTNLHLALSLATTLEPLHCLVISDGHPNSKDAALQEAVALAEQCIIDVLYIGPSKNVNAIEFMKQLARVGRGRFQELDITKESPLLLGTNVNRLLALPNPDETIEL